MLTPKTPTPTSLTPSAPNLGTMQIQNRFMEEGRDKRLRNMAKAFSGQSSGISKILRYGLKRKRDDRIPSELMFFCRHWLHPFLYAKLTQTADSSIPFLLPS